jgi:hypothetical protein
MVFYNNTTGHLKVWWINHSWTKIWFPCRTDESFCLVHSHTLTVRAELVPTYLQCVPSSPVAIVTAVFRSNETRQSFISFPLEEYINVTRWGVGADFHCLINRQWNEVMCREQRKSCYCGVRSWSESFTSVCVWISEDMPFFYHSILSRLPVKLWQARIIKNHDTGVASAKCRLMVRHENPKHNTIYVRILSWLSAKDQRRYHAWHGFLPHSNQLVLFIMAIIRTS